MKRRWLSLFTSVFLGCFALAGLLASLAPARLAQAIGGPPLGQIVGQVRAPDGSPMANAVVRAEAVGLSPFVTETLTGPGGQFTLTVVAPLTYSVSAFGPGAALEWYDNHFQRFQSNLIPVQAGLVYSPALNIHLDPGGAILGRVTRLDGSTPITNSAVALLKLDAGEMRLEKVDANGVYTFNHVPLGGYKVVAAAPGHVRQFFQNKLRFEEALPLNIITGGQVISQIDFKLFLGGLITGLVWRQDTGQPLPDVRVDAFPFGAPAPLGLDGARTDLNGVYTLGPLPLGQYRLTTCARCTGRNLVDLSWNNQIDPSQANPVVVNPPTDTRNINFNLLPGGLLTGTVRTVDGNPLPGAFVEATQSKGAPFGFRGDQTDARGVYTITGLPISNTYKLAAQAPGFNRIFYNQKSDFALADPIAVITSNGVYGPYDFRLTREPGGSIAGRVDRPDSGAAPFARVRAESQPPAAPFFREVPADNFGNFRLMGLVSGTYRLVAYPPSDPAFARFTESEARLIAVQTSPLTDSLPYTLTWPTVFGEVRFPNGNPAAFVGVHIWSDAPKFDLSQGTDPNGVFKSVLPTNRTYTVQVFPPAGAPGLVPPPPRPFVAPQNITQPIYLGVFTFTQSLKEIRVNVVRQTGGGPVGRAFVNVGQRGAGGFDFAQTDNNGRAQLFAGPGEWEVMIAPPPGFVDWVYSGQPKLVRFSADPALAETRVLTFEVATANAFVSGQVRLPSGEAPRPDTVFVGVRSDDGLGNGGSVGANGAFSVAVRGGTYKLSVFVDPRAYPLLSGPNLPPFTVLSGTTRVFTQPIVLLAKNAVITGSVQLADGTPVADLPVNAWNRQGGWESTRTAPDGTYALGVMSGAWEINVAPPATTTLMLGQPPQVRTVADGQTVQVNFVLRQAAGVVAGYLRDSNNLILTEVAGWAYARQPGQLEPTAGVPIEHGQFSLYLPSGAYSIGVRLPPGSNYTVVGEQSIGPLSVPAAETREAAAERSLARTEQGVTAQATQAVTVEFTLARNQATIAGAFSVTRTGALVSAAGVEGEVFAQNRASGAWQAAPIEADGRYTLTVSTGVWNVGYHIRSAGYINNPPPDSRVDVTQTGKFSLNFTLLAADTYVEGYLQAPAGAPLYGFAWAFSPRQPGVSAEIATGAPSQPPAAYFKIPLPADRPYRVGGDAPAFLGYIQPDSLIVTPTASYHPSVTLRFKDSNGLITGTVSLNNAPATAGWVYAWSDGGQHTGGPIQPNGAFRLNVVTGSVWHVGANWRLEANSIFYETAGTTAVDLTSASTGRVNLVLKPVGTRLPPSVGATFDPAVGWMGILSDGASLEIPAGAMPTTDTVRISISPLVEDLPNTLQARPFGYGYTILAFENSTGRQITQQFNANVLIKFFYSEADLISQGLTEGDLSPAYFSTSTNAWTNVEAYTIDMDSNQVTAQINHFSNWTLTTPDVQTAAPSSGHYLYLPYIDR